MFDHSATAGMAWITSPITFSTPANGEFGAKSKNVGGSTFFLEFCCK
jgi:hypothetical protein